MAPRLYRRMDQQVQDIRRIRYHSLTLAVLDFSFIILFRRAGIPVMIKIRCLAPRFIK